MTSVLIAIVVAMALGCAIVLALDPRARGSRLVSLSFPLGIAGCAMAMGALSAIRISWSRGSALTAAFLLLAMAVAAAVARRRRIGTIPHREAPPRSLVAWTLGAATGALVAGHALYATLAPLGEWDFWAIWGLKGRVFFEAAGVDWAWLERPANTFAHPDYPLLLPLAYDFVASLAGSWLDRELGLLFSVFGGSALLFAASHVRESSDSSLLAGVGALALSGPILHLPAGLGLADLPLLAFGSIGLLELRSALADGRSERIPVAAAGFACAAMTKNEGITLLVAAAAAMLVAGGLRPWRRFAVFVPAALAASGWIVLRRVHGLGTDLFLDDPVARLAEAGERLRVLLDALSANPPRYPFFWICAALAIALAGPRRLARERFLLVAVVLQVAFFLAAYLITPHDVVWHVTNSWTRLVGQLSVPVAFVALVLVREALRRDVPPVATRS